MLRGGSPEFPAVPLDHGTGGPWGAPRGRRPRPRRVLLAARDPVHPRAPAQPDLRRRAADRGLLHRPWARAHRRPGADHRRLLLRGLDPPAVHPPAQRRPRRGRRPGGLRRRGDHLHAARGQRLHAQGPRRLLHLALRRRLHRHALHARPPGALLREPLPLRRQGPRQGLRLRPAARAADRAPHLPPLVGRLGHRARRGGLGPPHPGRRAAHRDLPRRLPVHHRHRHRRPLRLHRGLREADAARDGRADGSHRAPDAVPSAGPGRARSDRRPATATPGRRHAGPGPPASARAPRAPPT